jgi:hypothetical protein
MRLPSTYSVSATRMPLTFPEPSLTNSTVDERKTRSPPSSWALATSKRFGIIGQG